MFFSLVFLQWDLDCISRFPGEFPTSSLIVAYLMIPTDCILFVSTIIFYQNSEIALHAILFHTSCPSVFFALESKLAVYAILFSLTAVSLCLVMKIAHPLNCWYILYFRNQRYEFMQLIVWMDLAIQVLKSVGWFAYFGYLTPTLAIYTCASMSLLLYVLWSVCKVPLCV